MNKGEAITHNLAGATGNIDYRGTGSNLHRQAIYDKNGNLVSTPENMGTYDFVSPNSLSGVRDHLTVDVQPWIEWGNSPNDTTTKQQRIDALKSTTAGWLGAKYLGY